jgi:hypothetical protein
MYSVLKFLEGETLFTKRRDYPGTIQYVICSNSSRKLIIFKINDTTQDISMVGVGSIRAVTSERVIPS